MDASRLVEKLVLPALASHASYALAPHPAAVRIIGGPRDYTGSAALTIDFDRKRSPFAGMLRAHVAHRHRLADVVCIAARGNVPDADLTRDDGLVADHIAVVHATLEGLRKLRLAEDIAATRKIS